MQVISRWGERSPQVRGLLGPRSHRGRRAVESPDYGSPLLPPDFSRISPRSTTPSTPFPVGTQKAVWGSTCSEGKRRQAERYHPLRHGLQDTFTNPDLCRHVLEVPPSVPLTGGPPARGTPCGQPTAQAGRRVTAARSPGRSAVTDLGLRARKLRAGPARPALRWGRLRLGGRAAEAPA